MQIPFKFFYCIGAKAVAWNRSYWGESSVRVFRSPCWCPSLGGPFPRLRGGPGGGSPPLSLFLYPSLREPSPRPRGGFPHPRLRRSRCFLKSSCQGLNCAGVRMSFMSCTSTSLAASILLRPSSNISLNALNWRSIAAFAKVFCSSVKLYWSAHFPTGSGLGVRGLGSTPFGSMGISSLIRSWRQKKVVLAPKPNPEASRTRPRMMKFILWWYCMGVRLTSSIMSDIRACPGLGLEQNIQHGRIKVISHRPGQ